jgi:hypothetical protein
MYPCFLTQSKWLNSSRQPRGHSNGRAPLNLMHNRWVALSATGTPHEIVAYANGFRRTRARTRGWQGCSGSRMPRATSKTNSQAKVVL